MAKPYRLAKRAGREICSSRLMRRTSLPNHPFSSFQGQAQEKARRLENQIGTRRERRPGKSLQLRMQ